MSEGADRTKRVPVKWVVAGVLVVALLTVIFQNTGDTKLSILLFDVTWPLWLLLSVFAAVAFVAGWFSGRTRD